MQERRQTVMAQRADTDDIRAKEKIMVRRLIHTVCGFKMRSMGSDGPTGNAYDDGLRIICGVGYNSVGYDLPYNESKSGKFLLYFIKKKEKHIF